MTSHVAKRGLVNPCHLCFRCPFHTPMCESQSSKPYNIYCSKCQGSTSPPIESKLIDQKTNSPNNQKDRSTDDKYGLSHRFSLLYHGTSIIDTTSVSKEQSLFYHPFERKPIMLPP